MIARTLNALASRRKQLSENEKEKGFTLIELLVVIIIIGILAAIAIPVFLNQRESAWKASVGTDLKNAAIVVETWGTDHNGAYGTFVQDDDNIQQSPDNTITVDVTAGTSYTITGSNSNIDGESQTYDSAAGGLQPWNE